MCVCVFAVAAKCCLLYARPTRRLCKPSHGKVQNARVESPKPRYSLTECRRKNTLPPETFQACEGAGEGHTDSHTPTPQHNTPPQPHTHTHPHTHNQPVTHACTDRFTSMHRHKCPHDTYSDDTLSS